MSADVNVTEKVARAEAQRRYRTLDEQRAFVAGALWHRARGGDFEQARSMNVTEKVADVILAEWGEPAEPRWEYGVKWGDEPDDSRPAICDSREHAESRAAESHGDKIVRRIAARTIPAGEWEEVPRD